MMKPSDIARLRLVSQRLVRSSLKDPGQIVAWMGAMQAQDLPMSLWAVGVRMRRATSKKVLAALNKGTILRTHVMRPTWHLVPARDLGWMLDLTAPGIKRGVAARHRHLGLTDRAISKSHALIERTISGHGFATRAQLVSALVRGGFSTVDNRMVHLLMLAELDRLICSGPIVDDESTYALMSDRVSRPVRLDREEALEVLLTRYLNSHGPATMHDYAWWSGLPMEDVRRSFEIVRSRFARSRVDGEEYWHRTALPDEAGGGDAALLLPAYDEFTIAYADRSASVIGGRRERAISGNGVFRPMVVVGGVVVGIWKRERTKRGDTVRVTAFERPSRVLKAALERAVERCAAFLGRPAELSITEGGVR